MRVRLSSSVRPLRIPERKPLFFTEILEVSPKLYGLMEVSEDDGHQPAE